jgi:hypothetical protein
MQDVRAGNEVEKIALGTASEGAQRLREGRLYKQRGSGKKYSCRCVRLRAVVRTYCVPVASNHFLSLWYTNCKFYLFGVLLGDFLISRFEFNAGVFKPRFKPMR